MAESKDWPQFAEWMLGRARNTKGGRVSLQRRWPHLRQLAADALQVISAEEVKRLLGRDVGDLDPERNDLKAIVAYAMGKGVLQVPERLWQAIGADETNDPLAFLAGLSGKTFGETWAPEITRYWVAGPDDQWVKKKGSDFYDAGWFPAEGGGAEVRIELKASSEHPGYRFQQIRHPRMSGGERDYDVLLCMGVTASSLEWWAIPTDRLDDFADNGRTTSESVVVTLHHGKRGRQGKHRAIWSATFNDEGWFSMDERARRLLGEFAVDSAGLRERLLSVAGLGGGAR